MKVNRPLIFTLFFSFSFIGCGSKTKVNNTPLDNTRLTLVTPFNSTEMPRVNPSSLKLITYVTDNPTTSIPTGKLNITLESPKKEVIKATSATASQGVEWSFNFSNFKDKVDGT